MVVSVTIEINVVVATHIAAITRCILVGMCLKYTHLKKYFMLKIFISKLSFGILKFKIVIKLLEETAKLSDLVYNTVGNPQDRI